MLLALEREAELIEKARSDSKAFHALQLLANRSKIHVDGFFGTMPGDQFVVDSSRVTSVKLAYLPRYPELSCNEDYDLQYVFEGEGHIAGRSIQFRAFVDAVVPD